MSEPSTLGALFDTPRTLLDRTVETQTTINSRGLDLTRRAVKPVVGTALGSGGGAEERVDDAFESLDETQAQLLEEVQHVAERPIDTSEDAAEWGVEFVDVQVGRLQEAGEAAQDVTGEVARSTEETAGEVADAAEETAEGAAEVTQATIEDTADAAQAAADSANDVGEDVVEDLLAEIDEAADEVDALDDLDESAAAGLAGAGVETVSDLATARVEAVADAAAVSRERAEAWIEGAVEYEDVDLADLEGIGETYSDRLAGAGVRTVDQLARTSAEAVAEIAEVDEDRAAEWIQRAQDEA